MQELYTFDYECFCTTCVCVSEYLGGKERLKVKRSWVSFSRNVTAQ